VQCEFCETVISFPRNRDGIIEHPLQEGLGMGDFFEEITIKERVFHCDNCGSERILPEDQVGLTCPFCASESVNESATDTRFIQPDGLIPFSVSKEQAYTQFRSWLGRGWFVPNNLRKLASMEKIEGVYLPFWTFDAETSSDWSADIGTYYYVTEYYRDANGNRVARQVQKVRWQSERGHFDWFFDDVLVIASKGVRLHMAQKIEPFKLDEVEAFNKHFLLGWETELYHLDLKDSYALGNQIMDDRIKQMIIQRLPGDTYRFLKIRTRKDRKSYKHLLLPCWVSAYRYKEKTYQFLINGQTGKVGGEKPLSPTKIALAVIGGLLLAAIIYLLVEEGEAVQAFFNT
jgi:hypothetical protein